MKTIDIEKLRKETFPKEVVSAYKSMCEAQVMFNITCESYAPKAPLKKGDKVKFKKSAINLYGIVREVKYRPYSHGNRLGPWFVSAKLTDSKFIELELGNKDVLALNDTMDIKLIES